MSTSNRKCKWCGSEFVPKGHEACCCTECASSLRKSNMTEVERVCQIPECGEKFTTYNPKAKFCPRTHYRECANPDCDNVFIVGTSSSRKAARKCCCARCSAIVSHLDGKDKEARRRNSQAKYGTDSPMQSNEVKEKIRKSLEKNPDKDTRFGSEAFMKNIRDKYGVDNVSKLDEVKEKKRATTLKNFGVDSPMKSDEIQHRVASTNMRKYVMKTVLESPEVREKARAATREKYGTDYTMQSSAGIARIMKTNNEKYGTDWATQSDGIKEKTKDTNMKKYGSGTYLTSDAGIADISAIMNDRYGVDNPFKSDDVQADIRRYWQDNFGVDNPSQLDEVKEKRAETIAERAASDPNFMQHHRISNLNAGIANRLMDDIPGAVVEYEPVLGNGMNADMKISLDGRSVIIDINPTVSHNMDVPFICRIMGCKQPCQRHENPITKSYHLSRARTATENLDMPYIQFYEWDSYDVILKLVSSHISKIHHRISAHDTDIVIMKSKKQQRMVRDFINRNHVQGSVGGQKHYYALFANDCTDYDNPENILAVATFGKPRFNKAYESEFLRYAVKHDWLVRGGSKKLFDAFVEDEQPRNMISYVDYDHTTKKTTFMTTLGFKEDVSAASPTVYWSKPGEIKRINNNSLVRLGADKMLNTHYGSREECGMNNVQIMKKEGWLQVPSSGNRVFVWENMKAPAIIANSK